jgi:hypothetical protein
MHIFVWCVFVLDYNTDLFFVVAWFNFVKLPIKWVPLPVSCGIFDLQWKKVNIGKQSECHIILVRWCLLCSVWSYSYTQPHLIGNFTKLTKATTKKTITDIPKLNYWYGMFATSYSHQIRPSSELATCVRIIICSRTIANSF